VSGDTVQAPGEASPFPDTATFEDGRLVAVGGVDVEALAAEFGTPLYVVDRAALVGRMRAYRQAFGAEVAVAYAAKALCVVGVLQLAAREGLYCDVASGGELATALAAGFPTDRLVFHGNNKSEAELWAAVDHRVGRIVVDSFSEIDRLERIASDADRVVDVMLRITPGIEAHTHAYIRTGQDDSKFGFTLSAGLAHEAIARVLAAPSLRLRGLHCHIGSQIFTPEAFGAAAETMCDLVADVVRTHGTAPEELNLGGGLGVRYGAADDPPPLDAYARTVRRALAQARDRHGLPPIRLGIEPGRSIAGPAGCTLYRVGTVKRIPDTRTYVSVDGGLSDNPRYALYGARYTFALAGARATSGPPEPVTVVGKHCESGDVLGSDVWLPSDLAEGDLVAVAATGAYNHSMASNYNRLPRPAMVLVADGRADPLVRRETIEDLVRLDLPLAD
jgi:diaminopimelate decarboxylase